MPCPLSALACVAGSRGVVELETHQVALLRRVCKEFTPTSKKQGLKIWLQMGFSRKNETPVRTADQSRMSDSNTR